MPADFAIGPSRKRRKPDRAGKAIKAVKGASSGPRTDAQTSGRNYGVRKATRFKATREYRQAVEAAVRAQPAAQRAKRTTQVANRVKNGVYTGKTPVEDLVVARRANRLAKAYANPAKRAERQRKMQLQARYTHRGPAQRAIATDYKPPGVLESAILGAIPPFFKDAPIVGPAIKGVGEATYHDPVGVPTKTAKGAVDIAAATPAALAQLVGGIGVPLATGKPGKAGSNALKVLQAAAADYSRRYGPLLRGEQGYDEFVQRIRDEGAAPELLDAAGFVTTGGAVTGRALGAAARAGKLGANLESIASAARPALRISANVSRPQELSRNLFVAAAEKGLDRARAGRLTKQTRRAIARDEAAPLQPPAGQVRPYSRTLERRLQRKDVSQEQSRAYINQRREFKQEVARGAQRDLVRLSRNEQDAVFHTVQGLLPVGGTGKQIREAATRRLRQIVGEREGRVIERILQASGKVSDRNVGLVGELVRRARREGAGPSTVDGLVEDLRKANSPESVIRLVRENERELSAALKESRALRSRGEMATLERIIGNADELAASTRLKAFQEAHLGRSKRLEVADPAFQSDTALVRRYGPQGEFLGIENPVRKARDEIEAMRRRKEITPERAASMLAKVDREAPERLREWVGQVKTAADEAGLPEPAYFRHQRDSRLRLGLRTVGNIKSATAIPRQSELRLFKQGKATTHPGVLLEGVGANIKRKHQWNAVGNVFDKYTYPWARNKSAREIIEAIHAKELDPNDFLLIDTKKYRQIEKAVSPEGDAAGYDPSLHQALTEAVTPIAGKGKGAIKSVEQLLAENKAETEKWLNTKGFALVDKGVGDELLAGASPPGAVGRVFGKVQGIQSAAILGLNPSWLMMQVAANTLATTFGNRGALADVLKGSRLYKQLSKAERDQLDTFGGIGVFEAHTGQHIGSVIESNRVRAARQMGATRVGVALSQVSPTTLMFRADDAQNRAFRRGVLTNRLKREAFRRIRQDSGRMAEAMARVEQLLKLGPTDSVFKQIRNVLENPKDVERLAESVNNVLGDFTRYTVRERRTLKNYVMFYGFLRYALKTAFYTMPVRHPIMSSIALKLGQLHVEEVKDLLGGDSAPWAYSRIFFAGKNGELKSVDLGRINPVTSPLTELVTEGPKAALGLTSPMLQAMADQVYGGVGFEGGRGFKVGGSAEENRNPDLVSRTRIFANQIGESAFPYRLGKALTEDGGRQGDDSLLFSPRPIRFKTAEAIARNEQRKQRAGSKFDILLQQIFPVIPRPDYSGDARGVNGGGAASAGAPTVDPEIARVQRELARQAQGLQRTDPEILRVQRELALALRGG